MTTQQQAYINGFVKRAAEYGFNEDKAVSILKRATAADAPQAQQDPSFLRGIKNLGINAIRTPKALYNGLMGSDSAFDHPASVPFVTGGAVGPKGLAGIPGRLMNYGEHISRSKEQRPDITGAGIMLGARLGDAYANAKPEHRDSDLAHVGARFIGGSIGGNALPLANQQRESMWSTTPSK